MTTILSLAMSALVLAHVATAVFGAQRLWTYELAGPLAVVPWLLPTAVGIPAIVVWTLYYRRKFERPAPAAA